MPRYDEKMDEHPRFGEWVKAARLAAGLTQQELAERVGIDRTYLVRIETGAIKQPGLDLRRRIQSALPDSRAQREADALQEESVDRPVRDSDDPALRQVVEFDLSDMDDDLMRQEILSLVPGLPRHHLESVYLLTTMMTSIAHNLPNVEFRFKRPESESLPIKKSDRTTEEGAMRLGVQSARADAEEDEDDEGAKETA